MSKGLTVRERLFVEALGAFKGNATKAAEAAGYKKGSAGEMGSRLLKKPHVRRAIDALVSKVTATHVKTRTELHERWSEMADGTFKGKSVSAQVALNAGIALEKSRGGFTQKLEVKGELGLIDLIAESMGRTQEEKYRPLEAPAEEPKEEPT